jgi:hypothetical protein
MTWFDCYAGDPGVEVNLESAGLRRKKRGRTITTKGEGAQEAQKRTQEAYKRRGREPIPCAFCVAFVPFVFRSRSVAQSCGSGIPVHLHISVMQIDSSVRFDGGTVIPLSVINLRSSAAVSG